ncbi:MAG: hypothetical protein OER88_10835 [Planctomycetota bacterium]|nr:hypothetical protein [Planctomycetota bacterium]
MLRHILPVGLLTLFATAAPVEKPAKLSTKMKSGQRYTGSNTIAYEVKTIVREGQKSTESTESIKRTERFVDRITRAGRNGVLEIERSYLKLYSTTQNSTATRKTVSQSPLQGRVVKIRETQRRRDIKLEGRGTIDPLVRRTVGMEIDWRDLLPDDPVKPGDQWNPEVTTLSRRLAAYLNCGPRGKMRVRYEENTTVGTHRVAKLYIDWTIEGMRDRNLFTKVVLAGDVLFDLDWQRVVDVDLTGSIVVRGAIISKTGPKIIKGEGPVTLKSSLKSAEIAAAASDEKE